MVGSNGTILHTTDGGITWSLQSKCTDNNLFAVSFTDENIGNIVGDNGVILRTETSGVTFVEEINMTKVPRDFLLFQNYPNPFNPATKIKYSLPNVILSGPADVETGVGNLVTLKVYDVLGNEITTLVNEEKPPGAYEINWNAANLPSGVYFYRLKAGEFIQSNKMVLLK